MLQNAWEWDGELPEAACHILHQHAIQGDLTDKQVAALRWRSLFENVRCGSGINLKVLYEALQNLEARWDRDTNLSYSEVTYLFSVAGRRDQENLKKPVAL